LSEQSETASWTLLRRLKSVARETLTPASSRARTYVGTDLVSGEIQFELLVLEGLRPSSRVLEIGCGALHAAIPILRFTEPDRFVGIDPNVWLRDTQLKRASVKGLVQTKRPRFLDRSDFDARETGFRFDFVLSHSILSHAANWQLAQFFENAAAVLAPGGKMVVSIRLAEGNDYGSVGSPDRKDTNSKDWTYPGVTFFARTTVDRVAAEANLSVVVKPEYTALMTARRPTECHDWLVIQPLR
jgi:cyclopropane fatty-acyl-phospholipid synthase-like methyltransferase